MKLLVLNGPNLNLLGQREVNVYGKESYKDLVKYIKLTSKSLKIKTKVIFSNYEGRLVQLLQDANKRFDGVVINPGALTHYSYSIYDAIKAIQIPVVEVHLSNIFEREDFRKISVVSPACCKTISGLGFIGYKEAINFLFSKNVNV